MQVFVQLNNVNIILLVLCILHEGLGRVNEIMDHLVGGVRASRWKSESKEPLVPSVSLRLSSLHTFICRSRW